MEARMSPSDRFFQLLGPQASTPHKEVLWHHPTRAFWEETWSTRGEGRQGMQTESYRESMQMYTQTGRGSLGSLKTLGTKN